MILPFVEQAPLYDSIDKAAPIWNQPAMSTPVSTFRCPSDGGRWEVSQTANMAVTNYSGSEGFHWHPTAMMGPIAEYSDPITKYADFSGLFTVTHTRRMGDVADGLSNTIFFAETDSMGFGGGPIRTSGTGARRTGTPVFRTLFVASPHAGWGGNESGTHTVAPDGSAFSSGSWFRNHAYVPTYLAAWGPNASWHGPSSYHPAGIQVGIGDGSVSFISESIDMGTWFKMNGIADGESIKDPR